MNLVEKRTELGNLVKQMREINDLADKEKRSFTPEEQAKYDAIEAAFDKGDAEIKAEEARTARAAKLGEREAFLEKAAPPATKPTPGSHRTEERTGEDHPYAKFFRFMPAPYSTPEYRAAFEMAMDGDYTGANKRAETLQAGVFTKGGALVPPVQWLAELLKNVDDMVFVRKYARIFRLEKAESLGVPKLDTDIDDADWTSELLTGNQGDFTFGSRELRPHPLAKSVKVSKKLQRVSAIPMDRFVRERLEYKFSITDEKAFLTGDGVQKPLGIFTASAQGISTARDVSTDNTTTAITGDGLVEAKGALKSQYHAKARWIFHRTTITKIRKLKDGNGQYLWIPGLSGSANPSTILDLPYDQSEYAPNTFTTGLYVGALVNWDFYWIADALDFTIQFVDQLYAATNQDGYFARRETDGMPVLEEAVVRVALA